MEILSQHIKGVFWRGGVEEVPYHNSITLYFWNGLCVCLRKHACARMCPQ